MNEKELGDALLKWDAMSQCLGKDPRELTALVLQRDRRRLRWWTILAAIFWIVALVGILTVFVAGGFAFPRIAQLAKENEVQIFEGIRQDQPFIALAKITAVNIAVTSLSLISLVFAGLGTLALVRASRQATLRQVNAGLVQITDELRHLRAALQAGGK